jgi:hypothetical protein
MTDLKVMTDVTVILPVHNGGNYLESSINSVLSQNLDDFVLHVLDDCSTDSSAEIAQSAGDRRVRYSRNPERFGLFRTLNRGFREATSPLVRIWAHDDVMLPGSLERFVRAAQMQPSAGMIYCDFFEVDSAGLRTGRELAYQGQRQRTPDISAPTLSALLFFCFGCLPGNISTVMLRREAWERMGGFVENIQQSPDYDMWWRVSEFFDVAFIRERLIELRDHPLQLAKVGQKQLTTIAEELPIFRDMQRRLNGALAADEIMEFWRQHRGRQHAHWIAQAFMRGDSKLAWEGWQTIRRYGQPWAQMVFWLASMNGRYFTDSPHEFFDRRVARLPLHS